ncbi:MAG: hypothetical protein BAJALOKI1v1_150032 [Promethearchaeota archaeon]|nr:MAG: hypothetical protein BAJALOKI1v1_150032 [Candidatus Lokiarchaeota archaeon]
MVVAENIASTRRLKLNLKLKIYNPSYAGSREHSFNKKIETLYFCSEIWKQ